MRLPLLGHIPGFAAVPALLIVMAGAGYAVVYTTGITRTTASRVGDISLTTTRTSRPVSSGAAVSALKRIPWDVGKAPVLNSSEVSDAMASAPLPSAIRSSSRRDHDFQRMTDRSFMNGGIGVHPRSSSAGSAGFGSGGFGAGSFGGGVSGRSSRSSAANHATPPVTPRRTTGSATHPSGSTGTGHAGSQPPAQTPTSALNTAASPPLVVAPVLVAAASTSGPGRGAAPVGAAPGPSPSPTPEPMSFFLVGAGLIGLWSARHTLR